MRTDVKPKPQFFRVGSSVVKEGALKAMTAVDLKVYMVLALHANWTTNRCWPSYRTIRTLSGCSFTGISGAVRRLVQLGAISCRKEKARSGLRNVYTVFRTLQASSGTHSRTTEYPPPKKKRDNLGRFHSSHAEDPHSRATEDLHSSRTAQNEINKNESNGIRSKESPPRPQRGSGSEPTAQEPGHPPISISEETIKKLLEAWHGDREKMIGYLRQKNYPIPPFLLGEDGE